MQYAYFYNFDKDEDGNVVIIPTEDESHAEAVLISTQEYHGLQKALRIVRDRAMQQIDKARADEHGYTLLRAERRRYSLSSSDEVWQVTKRTPYSLHIPIESVSELIKRDIEAFYGLECREGLALSDLIGTDSSVAEILRISCDYRTGVYEVVYWSPQLV